jgi:hypothetical protein
MYQRNEQGQTVLADRREMLRVKWKTLNVEIKFIKLEERKTYGKLQAELKRHRVDLELEARATLEAYQIVRYGSSSLTSSTGVTPKVKAMLDKYGKLATPAVETAYRPLRCDRVKKRERKAARLNSRVVGSSPTRATIGEPRPVLPKPVGGMRGIRSRLSITTEIKAIKFTRKTTT